MIRNRPKFDVRSSNVDYIWRALERGHLKGVHMHNLGLVIGRFSSSRPLLSIYDLSLTNRQREDVRQQIWTIILCTASHKRRRHLCTEHVVLPNVKKTESRALHYCVVFMMNYYHALSHARVSVALPQFCSYICIFLDLILITPNVMFQKLSIILAVRHVPISGGGR